MSLFNFFSRGGHVVGWEEEVMQGNQYHTSGFPPERIQNNHQPKWVHRRALVDWQCNGEIISEIDTFHYQGPPPPGRPFGFVINGRLVMDGHP